MWKTVCFERKLLPRQPLTFSARRSGVSASRNVKFPHFSKKLLECCRKNCYFRCDKNGKLLADHNEPHPFFLAHFLFWNSSRENFLPARTWPAIRSNRGATTMSHPTGEIG